MADKLCVRLLSPHAVVPMRATDGAAGYDLFAAQRVLVPSKMHAVVPTGIAVSVPKGTYGRVAPRSGLAVRHCLDVLAGVVDEDFRGELQVVLINHGDADYVIEQGARVAQLVLEKIKVAEVVVVDDLGATMRGAHGFGSTGC